MSVSPRLSLTLAHSPDPDDAFMWWPLVGMDGDVPAIDTGRFDFELAMDDIETLNQAAELGRYDITAISIAQYPRVREQYALTSCGASVGDGYGPKLVARSGMTLDDVHRTHPVIAVPGERTTALTVTRLMLGMDARWEAIPFDQIDAKVIDGTYDAGVVIHEGQLTCERSGLEVLADLGAWWGETRGMLLPLGGNVVKRGLEDRGGAGTLGELTAVLQASLEHAMANREASLNWALQFGRGIDLADADRFVEMYVNRWTLDFGEDGEAAVRALLRESAERGILPDPGPVDFVASARRSISGVDL